MDNFSVELGNHSKFECLEVNMQSFQARDQTKRIKGIPLSEGQSWFKVVTDSS